MNLDATPAGGLRPCSARRPVGLAGRAWRIGDGMIDTSASFLRALEWRIADRPNLGLALCRESQGGEDPLRRQLLEHHC